MTDLVTLKIDGHEVSVPKGTLVLDAATKLGIEIPIFCSHPKLDPVACCRMCLVEMSGPRGASLQPACAVPVAEGMEVNTQNENVRSTQEMMLGFILVNHPLDCPICDKGGECPLQDQTMRFGPGISQLVEPKRHKNKEHLISDTIVLDQERCVVCWRCIRYLQEWEDKPQLALFERGGETLIDIQHGQPVDAKTGGNIIDICPVGALTNRVARFNFRPWQIERTPSIDPHYSTGDNIRIDTRTHQIRRIVGRENMQVNDQWIADKTRFAYEWVNSDQRLQHPLVRKDGELVPASWSYALQYVVDRLKEISRKNGADAIGGIGSTKLSNESNYLFQRLMRQFIGTNNVDHRNGGDVAALATGLPALADIMKPQYGPNPKVDTIFLVGFDPSEELPILDIHLKRAVLRGGAKLIIAHPRQIELTRYKGPHLAYKPGSEVTMLNVLTKLAMSAGEKNDAELSKLLTGATQQALKDVCDVAVDEAKRAAELLAQSENALIIYGPMAADGPNGPQVINALTNLAMITGHYERLAYIGLDANSQGCRDMGVLPTKLPGHAELDDAEARARLEQLWGCTLPTEPGKTYKQMLDAAGGAIKALYVMGADPASERPDWAANLDKLDLLIVQDLFLTETAQLADVVLPALSWAESNGTFTNCERRVQRAPKALTNPHTKAAADWMILDHLASRLGANWPYADEKGVLHEITEAVPIYGGLTWEALGDQGLQWDAAQVRPTAEYRQAVQSEATASAEYPFALVTGTVSYDGGNMFALTKQMHNIAYGPIVGISPADADRLSVADATPVTVSSPYGALQVQVKISEQVKPGTVWIPESLPQSPVGALLNGSSAEYVKIEA
ncbi:MAG: NADH-quinone oxidoreductase subunit NuoG [Caldilineaceae bacterium]|nr:NADH-quinone oxidoreductase subunit NuoG [Caldilineaceae bacterium]